MMLVALIIYLLMASAYRVVAAFGILWWLDYPAIFIYGVLLVGSLPLAYLAVYLVDVYYPRMKETLRRYLRRAGTRWLSLISLLAAGGGFAYAMVMSPADLGRFSTAILLPIAAVALLNFLGIELPTRRIVEYPDVHPVPPRFFIPPLPSDATPRPSPSMPIPAMPDAPPPTPAPVPGQDPIPDGNPPPELEPDSTLVPDPSIPEPDMPDTMPPAPVTPEPEPLPDGMILRSYTWEYKGKSFSIDTPISRLLYDELSGRTRDTSYMRWNETYVSNGVTAEIRSLAGRLFNLGPQYGTYGQVDFVLNFVQSVVTYTRDRGEYPKYPLETLFDAAGDCEDFSILGASLLKCMGYEVALLFCPRHAALGVAGAEGLPGTYIEFEGHRYYYCEMTARGWQIGELPPDHTGDRFEVAPIRSLAPRVVLPEDL